MEKKFQNKMDNRLGENEKVLKYISNHYIKIIRPLSSIECCSLKPSQ